jgi:CheY-like chemotaxis protein
MPHLRWCAPVCSLSDLSKISRRAEPARLASGLLLYMESPTELQMTTGTVLLVEDDPDTLASVVESLEDSGYPTATAANGAEALAILRRLLRRSELPALILLDLVMPVMSGLQFIEQFEKDPNLAGVPIVVVSATADQTSTSRPLLSKPISLTTLLNVVEQYCTVH